MNKSSKMFTIDLEGTRNSIVLIYVVVAYESHQLCYLGSQVLPTNTAQTQDMCFLTFIFRFHPLIINNIQFTHRKFVLIIVLEGKAAALPYFYAPIGLLLLANIGLFCLSISAVRSAVEQRVEEELGLNAERNPCSYSKASRRVEM